MSRRIIHTQAAYLVRSRWQTALSCLWIIGFLWAFFDQQLPNNPQFHRWDIWELLLDELLGTDGAATVQPDQSVDSGWMFLTQRLPLIGRALLLLLAAAALGHGILRSLIPDHRFTYPEQAILIMGSGLSVQSLIVLLCGLAGLLTPLAILLPGGLAAAASLWQWWRKGRFSERLAAMSSACIPVVANERNDPSATALPHAGLLLPCILILLPFSCYLLLGSMSPQTDFDVREYHLQGPKEWFQQGSISFLRHNVYTSFPFLTEMFSLAGMVLNDDWSTGALSGQFVLGTFGILTSACVYCIASRLAGPSCGLLAALIHLTTPWTLRISIIAYAEGGLTFYLAASILSLLLLKEFAGDNSQRIRFATVIGILAGSAMACKYTGLVTVVVPACLLLGVTLWNQPQISTTAARDRFRTTTAAVVAFACGTSLAIGPWLARNAFDTGNPVYPLAYGIFGGSEWSPEMDARWRPAHAPGEHSISRLPQWILDFSLRNDWTSGLLFALAIPSLLLLSRIRGSGTVAAMTFWTFATWWALTHRIDRFWIPAIPLLAVMASLTWKLSDSRAWKSFLIVVIFSVTLFNIRFCLTPLTGFHAGLMDLKAAHELTVRSDFRLLNSTLPPDARVLMVGEAEVFNATFDVVYNTVFDDSIFELWTANADVAAAADSERPMRPPAEIAATLREHRITHVLVNWSEILRYRSPGSYGYPSFIQPARFNQLVADQVLKSPVPLLTRPWSTFTPEQQQLISEWSGFESLIDTADDFSSGQLFEVQSKAGIQPSAAD